eukprot:GCRY01001233.1.p1 GENE.GCRY01001233.1~~GCRY01001233.1.p1  ORF type:complete len:338 (+),score=73.37 GCRY01001233.1:159-1172(+)
MNIKKLAGAEHLDIIHDVSYDFYGTRMASCSSDQKIRIWDLVEERTQSFECTAVIQAHSGSIWRVAWAHPEFGQVIASCSYDKTICIWEEQVTKEGAHSWLKRATLLDSGSSVRDVCFAPRHLGFKLASCCGDGYVRVYEALDVMNLAHWPLQMEFFVSSAGCNSICWSSLRGDPPLLAVGSYSSDVTLWMQNDRQKWEKMYVLRCGSSIINSIDWAPNFSRGYHLIAGGSRDGKVYVWKFPASVEWYQRALNRLGQEEGNGRVLAPQDSPMESEPSLLLSAQAHAAEIWRVRFNVTGTVLASCADDCVLKLYGAAGTVWKEIGNVTDVETVSAGFA